MGGLDAPASVEAVCVCLGAFLVYWIADVDGFMVAPLAIAILVAVFCVFS